MQRKTTTTISPITAIGAAERPSIYKEALSSMRALAKGAGTMITVEEQLADALWRYGRSFTVTSKGKVLPDYHGRSAGYQAGYQGLLQAAGLVVVEATTPFQGKVIDLAVNRIETAVRKQRRIIADRELSLSELLNAGYKRSKGLPADQKIPASVETGTRTVKDEPIKTVLDGALNGLEKAAKRPTDIRDLTLEERAEYLARLINLAGIVGRTLRPTKAEEAKGVTAPTLTGGDLVAGLKAEKAARTPKAPSTAQAARKAAVLAAFEAADKATVKA